MDQKSNPEDLCNLFCRHICVSPALGTRSAGRRRGCYGFHEGRSQKFSQPMISDETTNSPWRHPRPPKEVSNVRLKFSHNTNVIVQREPFRLKFRGHFEDLEMYDILKSSFQHAHNGSIIYMFVKAIFENIFTESINAVSVSKYIFVLSHEPKKGPTLRTVFFKLFQEHYNERKKILNQSEVRFKNFALFFIAIVHHNRHPTRPPIEGLVESLLDFAEMLTPYLGRYEDLKLYCILLLRVSQYLKMDSATYSRAIFERENISKDVVRRKCKELMSNGEPQSLSLIWLVMVLDGDFRHPNTDFYDKNLGHHEISPLLDDEYKIRLYRSDLPTYQNIKAMKEYLTIVEAP